MSYNKDFVNSIFKVTLVILALVYSSTTLNFSANLHAQSVLFDDVNSWHEPVSTWFGPLFDTLRAHGADLDFSSEAGFHPSRYELLWITFFCDGCFYSEEEIDSIIEFVRNGGELVINANDFRGNGPLNELLADEDWTTGMFIIDTEYPGITDYILPFPPFTDGVTEIQFWHAAILDIRPPALPFIFNDAGDRVFAAISYPLEFDCETSGRIFLFADADFWEYWTEIIEDNYRLASNILLATAIPPLEDCLNPPGIIFPDSVDCGAPGETINAYGSGFTTEMLLYLADSNIAFTWIDSFTIEFTILDSLLQGIYPLRIDYNIESLSVTTRELDLRVYCDWLELFWLDLFCGNIGDTTWFYGDNFSMEALILLEGSLVDDYEIVNPNSGWFIIPEVIGGPYFRFRLENSPFQYVQRIFRIPCTGCLSDSIYAVISNVWFYEEIDGSDRVHIFYDLAAPAPVAINIEGSPDGGMTWSLPLLTTAGDVGNGISEGENLEIVWEAGLDYPDIEDTTFMFAIVASDSSTGIPGYMDSIMLIVTVLADSIRELGFSVSGAGDVDNDGIDDIIIGAPSFFSGYDGAVYILKGRSGIRGSYWASSVDVVINSRYDRDDFGFSVSTAGDVNNDGYDDVIMGAPRSAYPEWPYGRAYLFFGSPSFSGMYNVTLADVTFEEELSRDWAGWSVSSAGDVNNDGFSDVIIGAPKAPEGPFREEGRAYVFLGSSTFEGHYYLTDADITVTGENEGDFFGASVSSAGDINGDGYSDIIIGAPKNDESGFYAGRAYIFYGSSTFSGEYDAIDADIIVTGMDDSDSLGGSVSDAGDINNDGFGDFIIGAPCAENKGNAYIFYGSPGLAMEYSAEDADIIIQGEEIGDLFGFSVSSGGDVDLDGYDEIVIGAPGFGESLNEGRAYIFYGSSYFSGTYTAGESCTILNAESGSDWQFGLSVSSAGQFNNESGEEVIVGSSRLTYPRVGLAYVYSIFDVCPYGNVYCEDYSPPGALDTRIPRIGVTCPESVVINQSSEITWTAEDMFLNNNPIDLFTPLGSHLYQIANDEENDGSFTWRPLINVYSRETYIIAEVSDSFGHFGYDTCGPFPMRGDTIPPDAEAIDPEDFITISSCIDESVVFVIHDNNLVDTTICVIATDGRDWVNVMWYPDSMLNLVDGCTLIVYLPDLEDSTVYSVTLVSAQDIAGNNLEEESVILIADRTPPEIRFVDPPCPPGELLYLPDPIIIKITDWSAVIDTSRLRFHFEIHGYDTFGIRPGHPSLSWSDSFIYLDPDSFRMDILEGEVTIWVSVYDQAERCRSNYAYNYCTFQLSPYLGYWMVDLHFTGENTRTTDVITLGAGGDGTEYYDPGLDIINLPQPDDRIEAYFSLEDSIHFYIERLTRDIKYGMPPQIWNIMIEHDNTGYIEWSPEYFPEGDFVLDSTTDMRVDSIYYFESRTSLVIEWNPRAIIGFGIELFTGWNLVSLPVQPVSNYRISVNFPSSLGAWGFNPAPNSYVEYLNVPRGEGFWVHSCNDTLYSVYGQELECVCLELGAGWNLIGAPYTTAGLPLSAVETRPPGAILTGSFYYYDPLSGSYLPVTILEKGKGYWVCANANCRIILNGEFE